MIKGEYAEAIGPKGQFKKHRQLRRIAEYEKFLGNCAAVKERLEAERRGRERERVVRRNTVMGLGNMRPEPRYSLLIRANSLTYLDVLQTGQGDTRPPSPKTGRLPLLQTGELQNPFFVPGF